MTNLKQGEKLDVIPPNEDLQKIIEMNAAIVRMNTAIVKVLCIHKIFVATTDSDGDRQ